MATDPATQDRTVLRLKLRAVNRYIETLEALVERFRGEMYVKAVRHERGDPTPMLVALGEAMERLAEVGTAKSLFVPDLPVGRWGQASIANINHRMERLMINQGSPKPDSDQFFCDVAGIAADVIEMVHDGLEPARQLRDTYVRALDRRAARRETAGQAARRKRDQVIKELVEANPSRNVPQLLALARQDDRLQDGRVKLSRSIVRRVAKAARKKLTSRKKTRDSQRKRA